MAQRQWFKANKALLFEGLYIYLSASGKTNGAVSDHWDKTHKEYFMNLTWNNVPADFTRETCYYLKYLFIFYTS